MKRIICLVTILSCAPVFGQGVTILPKTTVLPKTAVFPGSSSFTWTFKQSNSSNNTGGCGTVGTGLCTTTYTSANTSGSLLVACFWINWTSSEQTISSVTDPTNGSWTVASGSLVSDATNDFFIQCAYVHNTASTALTVSLTLSSFTFNYTGVLYEASDGNTTNPLDQTSTAVLATSSGWTTTGVTTGFNNELLLGFGVQDSGAAQAWTACASPAYGKRGTASTGFIIEDFVQATGGSGTTACATYATTVALMGNLMTFKP
jgi:hypothetical protein